MSIPTGTITKQKRQRAYITDCREGPYEANLNAPRPGSLEAAAAIKRAVQRRDDPAEVRRRQRTPPVGRAAGESAPKPPKPAPRLRSDPVVTARALELRTEGKTWPEIGRELGEKPNNIRIRCARALREDA